MTFATKQFNVFAWVLGVCVLVYLGGAVFALVTDAIKFGEFSVAVGIPMGPMIGWAAKTASGQTAVPADEKLLS